MYRRKKVRSVLRDTSTRNRPPQYRRREQSLNKFRIQECSYYTHQRNDSSMRARPRNDSKHDTSNFSNSNINITTICSTKNTIDRRRGFSRKKILPDELTIEPPSVSVLQKDYHLKNLYNKLREKCDKPDQKKNFRRDKYEKPSSEINTYHNLQKLAYTVNNLEKVSREMAPTEQLRARNKTIVNINPASEEAAYQNQVRQKPRPRDKKYYFEVQSQIISGAYKEQTKYSSVDIQKKESNTSLIRELDMQTQKEAEQQDRAISIKIKKILDKSLEKSTEEYFKEHSGPRNLKSRNQIDIYMSTVKNPSAYRCSQASTLNVSDKKEELFVSTVVDPSKQDLLSYDFNLEQEVAPSKPPRDNTACFLLPEESEDSGSVEGVNPLNQFERERKDAERRFAQHENVRIDWSDEDLDCTVKAEEIDC